MSGTLSEYICQTCFQMIYRKLCQNNLSWWGSPEADGKINYGDLAMNNSHLSLFFPSRHVGKPCLTGVFFPNRLLSCHHATCTWYDFCWLANRAPTVELLL
jgi:hypothetical protein